MIFIETSIFTREIQALLPDDSYKELQRLLMARPARGRVILGSGGLRKLRWAVPGSGKRGGLRIIYHWDAPADTFYMLLAYAKSQQEDLTPDQLKVLSKLVKELLK
jgi:hypothetical protein